MAKQELRRKKGFHMLPKIIPTLTKSWQKLNEHYAEINNVHMKNLLGSDPKRLKKYVKSALKRLVNWLTNYSFKDYVSQIEYLIEIEKWDFSLNTFCQVIPVCSDNRGRMFEISPIRLDTNALEASSNKQNQDPIKGYENEVKHVAPLDQKTQHPDNSSNSSRNTFQIWTFFFVLIAWSTTFMVLIIFTGFDLYGLGFDSAFPYFFLIILVGLTKILRKICSEIFKNETHY